MGISSIIILPLIVLFIIIYGFIKKVNIYDEFLNGALDGLKTTIKIIPNLVAMIFAINILIKSNIITDSFFFLDNVLKRLFELDKPYAMLLPIPSLQGQARFEYIKDGLQYLGFDKRINYYMNSDFSQVQKGVSFGSCYLCKKFLPSDLILEELKTKN